MVQDGSANPWTGWSNLYDLSYLLGCLLSCGTYYVAHRISPIQGLGVQDDEDYFGTFRRAIVIDGVDSMTGSSVLEKEEKVKSAV